MTDKLKALITREERAVSPVIGVILMVAITVILAAVIGTFVLGLGNQVGNSAPTASLNVQDGANDYSGGTGIAGNQTAFTIGHDNGDPLNEENLRITIRNADTNSLVLDFDPSSENITNLVGNATHTSFAKVGLNGVRLQSEDDITVGDSLSIYGGGATSGDADGDASVEAGHTAVFSDNTDYIVTVIHVPSESQLAQRTIELT